MPLELLRLCIQRECVLRILVLLLGESQPASRPKEYIFYLCELRKVGYLCGSNMFSKPNQCFIFSCSFSRISSLCCALLRCSPASRSSMYRCVAAPMFFDLVRVSAWARCFARCCDGGAERMNKIEASAARKTIVF